MEIAAVMPGGSTVVTVVDSDGLYFTTEGVYVVDLKNLAVGAVLPEPLVLRVGTKPFATKIPPKALIQYEDGSVGVLSKPGSTWLEQKFDASGAAAGKASKLTTSALLGLESRFAKDIDGINGIGDTVIETVAQGNGIGLYRTASGGLIIGDAETGSNSTSSVLLLKGSKPFTQFKGEVKGVIAGETEFGVVLLASGKWTEQTFSLEGQSGAIRRLSLSEVLSKEFQVQMDFNGDNHIGDTVGQSLAQGNAIGLYSTSSGGMVIDVVGLQTFDSLQEPLNLISNSKPWTVKTGTKILGIAEGSDQHLDIILKTGSSLFIQKIDLNTGSTIGELVKFETSLTDSVSPVVTEFSPADDSQSVPVDSNITFSFNEIIQKGEGSIFLRLGSAAGTIIEQFDVATKSQIDVYDSTLTVNPASDLLFNTEYFITLDSGIIRDLAGNVSSGITTFNFKTERPKDTTAPIITNFSPADDATRVVVDTDIVITFNEIIQKGEGKVYLRSGSPTGTIVEQFDIQASAGITLAESTLTINPTADLANNTEYFLTLTEGAVKDLVGNEFLGFLGYNFRTEPPKDTIAPIVSSFNPADGAINVTVGANITLTFNEFIQKGIGTLYLRQGSATGAIVEQFDITTSSRISLSASALVIDPTDTLALNTDYFVTLDTGLIQDLAGNQYAGTASYNFRTEAAKDTTSPVVSHFSPTDGATNVAIGSNIILTFNEAVQKGVGTITLRSGSVGGTIVEQFDVAASNRITASQSTVVIDPTASLAADTEYFVSFGAGVIKDLSGNSYAGTSSYNFKTAAASGSAPMAVSYLESRADWGYAWYVNYDLGFSGGKFTVTTRIDLTGDSVSSSTVNLWENGIESLWNAFSFKTAGGTFYPVVFDVQFVGDGSNEHYDVEVANSTGRSNMLKWYLATSWGPEYQDEIAAHEYGHMIGMFDEYSRGATFNNYTTSGTLMSDLSHNLPTGYLFGVESYAESIIGQELTTVKVAGLPDSVDMSMA